jgi:hypothetical protein
MKYLRSKGKKKMINSKEENYQICAECGTEIKDCGLTIRRHVVCSDCTDRIYKEELSRTVPSMREVNRMIDENINREEKEKMNWKVTSDTWFSDVSEIFPTRREAESRAAELQAALDEEIEVWRESQRDDFGVLPPLTNWQADKHFFVSPATGDEVG